MRRMPRVAPSRSSRLAAGRCAAGERGPAGRVRREFKDEGAQGATTAASRIDGAQEGTAVSCDDGQGGAII